MTDEILGLRLGLIVAIVAVLVAALGPWRPRDWVRRRFSIPPAIEWTQGTTSADASSDAPSADQA